MNFMFELNQKQIEYLQIQINTDQILVIRISFISANILNIILFSLFQQQYSYILEIMIEFPKEGKVEAKNAQQDQNNSNPKKQNEPQSQEIVEQFIKINGEKCNKIYKKISFLGKGGFAQCYLTQQKDTNRRAATKIIPKKLLDTHRTKIRLANEIKLHKSLRHENVVQFYNTFEDEQNVYISLQVCENGCLNDILRARYSFRTPEVQSFLYGICQGLKYLHSRNIIHRDLKLGNIFLGSDLKVKIGDFGLACKLQFQNQYKRTVCGTPNYIAPEILQGKGYHFQVDIWAIGVIIFTLFYTIPPFETQQPHTTYQKIRKCEYQIPKYAEVPPEAIDLIKKLLVPNPSLRLTIDQILDSPFMRIGGSIPIGLPLIVLNRPVTKKDLANWPKIITVQEQNKQMNGTVLSFLGLTKKNIANQKLPSQQKKLSNLNKQIQKQDLQSTGLIICRTAEQSSNQIIVFSLNNGNFGVFDLIKSIALTCRLRQKSQKNQELVRKTGFDESGIIVEDQLQLPDTDYKIFINLKHKQLLQNKAQLLIPKGIQTSTTVSKINTSKDVTMIRLTNRTIQIMYKQNDGFVLTPTRKRLFYFYSFSENEQGKQIDFNSVFGEKQNKLNSSTHSSISSFFKSKRNQKNYLTMKKIGHLKSLLTEKFHRNTRKTF